VYAKEEMRQKL